MRTSCDFVFVDNVTLDTSNHSNVCACNFIEITGCNFSYLAPVISYQFLESIYTLIQDLQPTAIGMNLTLVKELLQQT